MSSVGLDVSSVGSEKKPIRTIKCGAQKRRSQKSVLSGGTLFWLRLFVCLQFQKGGLTMSYLERTHALVAALKMLLGAYYDELYWFFQTCISRSFSPQISGNRYIAFTTRRCYCLAYLFYRVFQAEHINDANWKDKLSKCVFLTNSSLSSLAEVLVAQDGTLKMNEVAEILIVDDSINYGRATLEMMDTLKESLRSALEAFSSDVNKISTEIDFFLNTRVFIRVYAKKDQTDILPLDYQQHLTVSEVMTSVRWNNFSICLSETVYNTDVVNAAFVLSAGVHKLPDSEVMSFCGWQEINSRYQDHDERVFFYPIFSDNLCRAVCSVRCFRCVGGDYPYRIVPFVFLPEFSEDADGEHGTLTVIKMFIEDRLRKHSVSSAFQALQEFFSYRSKRKLAEFLTLFLSLCALRQLFDTFSLDWPEEHAFDCEKLSWNYATKSNDAAKEWLSDLCQAPEALANFDEISNLLQTAGLHMDFWSKEFTASADPAQQMITDLEDDLFRLAVALDRNAYQIIASRLSSRYAVRRQLDTDRRIVFYDFVCEYMERHPSTRGNLLGLLALILNVMDVGCMSIVLKRGTEEHHGKRQYIRICEQALPLWPRRYYCHLEVLKWILLRYENTYEMRPVVQTMLEAYVKKLRDRKIDKTPNLSNKLLAFWEILITAPRIAADWDIEINRHFSIQKANNGEMILVAHDEAQLDKFSQQDRNYNIFFSR